MARSVIPVTELSRDGIALPAETDGDPVNQHLLPTDGRTLLVARNADGVNPETITFQYATIVDGQPVESRIETVPAGSTRYFGPFPPGMFGSEAKVNVSSADLKLSAIHL